MITPPPASEQLRAIVRIDPEPGGKMFQGVWLDQGGDKRFLVDYRARGFWRAFEGHEVVVTGHCYAPSGQAMAGQHFRVATLRFLTPAQGRGPLLEIGPALQLRGRFTEHAFPAGSKLAGAPRVTLVADDEKTYWIAGTDRALPAAGTTALVEAREVRPDLSYAAQPGGPTLWITQIRGPNAEPGEDPEPATPCP